MRKCHLRYKKYSILRQKWFFLLHTLALSDLLWLYPWIWITLLLDLAHSGELLLSQALIGSQVLDSLHHSYVAKVCPALLHMLTYLDANSNPDICIYASHHVYSPAVVAPSCRLGRSPSIVCTCSAVQYWGTRSGAGSTGGSTGPLPKNIKNHNIRRLKGSLKKV